MKCCQLVTVIVSRDYVEMWYGLHRQRSLIRRLENEVYLKGKCIKKFQFHTFTVFLVGPPRLYVISSSEEFSMVFWVIWKDSAMYYTTQWTTCPQIYWNHHVWVSSCTFTFRPWCFLWYFYMTIPVSTRAFGNWALVHFGLLVLITLPNFMHLIHIQHPCGKGY